MTFQPGRPRGARNRFAQQFLTDLMEDWRTHGANAIKVMRVRDPGGYVKVCASLVPRELEVVASKAVAELSDEDIARYIADYQARVQHRLANAPSIKMIEHERDTTH
jgi:hypothetical protein